MKKVVAILLLVVMTLSLTACSKEVITADTFKEKAEDAGAKVYDEIIEDDNRYKNEIVKAYNAEHDDWSAVFYELSDEDDAEDMYYDYAHYLEDRVVGMSKSTGKVSGLNFERYTITADGEFNYVCYVDNTVLMISGDDENKDAVKDFADKLGYK